MSKLKWRLGIICVAAFICCVQFYLPVSQKSVEEVANIIQSRVSIYIGENS